VGLAGLALALQARTATPSPWSIAPACCSMPKDCTSLPRCLARKSAAAAYPGTPRPAGVIGLMVVLAAGLLSGLEPGMHTRPAATVAGAPLTMP